MKSSYNRRNENIIWEFYKTEGKHGTKATAYDIDLNGRSRSFVFSNDPAHQRTCHCQECDITIPREVPRIHFSAQYYYGAGYYCISCGMKKLDEKTDYYKDVIGTLEKEMENIKEILAVAEEVFKDEFYEKKMSMARLCQVMAGKEKK